MGRLGYGELEAGAETAAAQAFHPQGTVSSPGLSFSGDANTGWYLQGEDTIGHVVGGVEQFRVSSAAFVFQLSTAISSSGTLTITAPTITTPTIASTGWANATHTHAGGTTGGQVAITATTGTLLIANGGTSSTSASAARTALGLAIGSNVQAYDADLAAIAGLGKSDSNFIVGNGSAWVAEGASTARTSLGLAIGSDVQAYDADLAAIAGLGKTDSNFIVGNGSAWVAEGASTARTSLGLGSLATASTINNGNWSGTDLSVLNGGTGASSLADLITLGTHTTGNYAATVADLGAGGILVANSGAESAAITVQLNVHGLTTDTLASGDFIAFSDEDEANDVTNKLTVDNLMETGIPLVTEDTVAVATDYMLFLDGGATGNTNKESIADFVSGIAGTNVTASSGQLSVGAAGAGLGLVIALS
jgi:hypothetical protein